jgi:hypothetical protein
VNARQRAKRLRHFTAARETRPLTAAVNPAVYALAGSLIGGLVAGTFSLLVAGRTQRASERAWMRDNRREIYDRFLTHAQRLLVALVEPRPQQQPDELHDAYVDFASVYAVVQAVAERDVVDAARTYGKRLIDELKPLVDAGGRPGDPAISALGAQVRLDRQATIDSMRNELGLTGSAKPSKAGA